MSTYTTKATWLGNQYGCRVFQNGKLIVEGRTPNKAEIGAVFRDLLRTIDKSFGDDKFTNAARIRMRKFAPLNHSVSVKHIWYI